MKLTKPTVFVICILIFLVILALDALLLWSGSPTLTQAVIWASDYTHVVPALGGFLMGFLTAHFWN